MATEVPLGPPSLTGRTLMGIVLALPLGFGMLMPPHGLLFGLSGAGYVTYFASGIARGVVDWRRFATENNLALAAEGRGELAKAREVFVRWAPNRHRSISAVARHNLGWILMLEGSVADAATILEDAEEYHSDALIRHAMLPTTRADTALCHALLGHLDKAEAWYAKAQEPVKGPPRPAFYGLVALVRAVIDCRKGHASEAMVALEHAWTEHETTMTGETVRLMRVVRSFACATAAGPRNQGIVERVLGDMKPRYTRELAFLGDTWPEMSAFLTAHRLAG